VHDARDQRDLVQDEWLERMAGGFAVAELEGPVGDAVASADPAALTAMQAALTAAPRRAGWPYAEPQSPAEVLGALVDPQPAAPWAGTATELGDRLRGAWLARCAGCVMGKPVESLPRSAVRAYLRAAGAWPLTGYVPLVTQLPEGVDRLHPAAELASAGHFSAAPRDDDLDYTVLGLHLLETYGPRLTVDDVAREWLDRVPFTQTYTAERAAYRNLVRGVPAAEAAEVDNPYREWIGALIRADAFGYVAPGDPRVAVRGVVVDATLSHRGNGLAAALWGAALVAAAFTAPDARTALGIAGTWIPPGTRLRAAQDVVLELHDRKATWDEVEAALDAAVGHYSWVHAINNAAAIAAALLWGDGDLGRSVGLVVGLGWDTDSSGATVGSVIGALHGTEAVPEALAAPLGDTLRSAIRDFDRSRISALAERTLALAAA
jgi:ADP-ribosylglycohydrolase